METVTHLEVKVEPTWIMESESTAATCLMCLQPLENEELKLIPEMMSSILSLATALEVQKLHSVTRSVFSEGMEQGSYCERCFGQLSKLNVLHNRLNRLQESISKLETKIQDDILVAYFKDGHRLHQSVSENELVAELSRQLYRVSVEIFTPDQVFENDDFDAGSDSNGCEDNFRDVQSPPNTTETSDSICTHSQRRSFRVRSSTYKIREQIPRSSKIRNSTFNSTKKRKERMEPANDSSCDKLNQRTSVQLKRMNSPNSNSDSNQKLKAHRKISTDRKGYNFNCSKCCARFKKTSHLVGHVDKVHTSSEYSCSHCSGTFNNTRNLKIHKDLYHPSEEVPTPGSSSKSGRRPMGKKNISCPHCTVRFTHLTHFKTHLEKKHSEIVDNYRYPCPVCVTKIFFTEQRLNAHLNRHHLVLTKSKNHKCDVCDRSFLKKGDLINHVSTHSEGRAFICDICGVRTKRSQELLRHKKMTHSSERPFHCDTCGKRFTFKWQLAFHMKNHQSQRDYTCTVEGCLKTFKFSGNLKQHLLVHKGTKFICHICGESYTRIGYLKKHIKLLHGDNNNGVNLDTETQVVPRRRAHKLRIALDSDETHPTINVAELNSAGLQYQYAGDGDPRQRNEYDEVEEVDSEGEYEQDEEVSPEQQPLQIEYCQIVNVNQDRRGTEYILIQQ